jgi:uncharacterized protein
MYQTKQGLAPHGAHTYDTRPMPDDGLKLCNVAVLAQEARTVTLAVPLNRLERVAPQLINRDGMVTGSVALAMEQGRVVADVALAVQVELRCQRCLEPMQLAIETQSRVALLNSEAAADDVPPELEMALAPEGRMRLADLIEEELLLALPAAPRHEGQCPSQQGSSEQNEFEEPTQRPFAALGELLKSGRSKQ